MKISNGTKILLSGIVAAALSIRTVVDYLHQAYNEPYNVFYFNAVLAVIWIIITIGFVIHYFRHKGDK